MHRPSFPDIQAWWFTGNKIWQDFSPTNELQGILISRQGCSNNWVTAKGDKLKWSRTFVRQETRDATQPKAPLVLYRDIQLTQQLFSPFGSGIPFNCQLKTVSAAREQEWQPLTAPSMTTSSFFSLFNCSKLQSDRQWRAFFVAVVLNCGVRILVVISVFRPVDRTHTKQPICQLLPLMQKLPRAWRLGQNPLGWLWHQLQMS